MTRNEWHRVALVLSPSGILMVLVDGESVIQVPDKISELVSQVISRRMESGQAVIPSWPFGALFIGNYGLKASQVESGSKDWLNELTHGAISGVIVQPHALSEMSALFSLLARPSPPPTTCPTVSPLTTTTPSNFVRIERRSDLGGLESAIFGSSGNSSLAEPSMLLPPNSFPIPSRICRPLYSVAEMDDWEKYLSAFSTLDLKAFKPVPLQPRRAMPSDTPPVLLCHDFKGGYFKDSAWERSPPLNFDSVTAASSGSSTASSADSSPSVTGSAREVAAESRHGFDTFASESFAPTSPTTSDTASVSITDYVPLAYTFEHWSYIDIFCYFSHARVTIPPVATINAAHMNGVKVLGTFITEWEDGYLDTMRLIAGKDGDKAYYAKKLVLIAKTLDFEGWLVNIEHSMKEYEVPLLVAWMKEFKKLANEAGLMVVWYDSVIKNGELKWQSALNAENMIWFDVCDLFFTDYHWKLGNLETTMLHAKEQAGKVLYGIDVWGRGTYGGGGWNVPAALKAIADTKYVPPATEIAVSSTEPQSSSPKLGVAIFGPGWTIETQADSYDSLYRNEALFWQGIARWNLLSKPFEKHLKSFYRLYPQVKDPGVDFTVDDILSILEWSEDGAYGKAQEQARAQSLSQLNEVAGRFKGLPQLFEPRTGGAQWSWRHIRYDLVPSTDASSLCPSTNNCIDPSTRSTPSTPSDPSTDASEPKITAELLDSQPELTLSLWVKGNGPNSADPWRLRVLLLDASNRLIQEFDTGIRHGTAEWKQMTFKWAQYGSGVRSILWLDGTRDAEGWAGFYGCTIDRPSILLDNPSRVDSIATYIEPRKLQNSTLPIVAAFEYGQGSSLYSSGEPLVSAVAPGGQWYNLAAQTEMPSLQITLNSITPSPSVRSSLPRQHASTPLSSSHSGELPRATSIPNESLISAIRHVSARLVDASTVDGGVWHGSTCLRLDASIKAPSQAITSTDDSIVGASTAGGKKRTSSRKLLLSSTRLAYPRTEATIELFPLAIDRPNARLALNVVFRPIHIPSNSTVLVSISRKKKSTGTVIAPLQWDLMDKEYRDPNGSSSLGWIHFLVSWVCEPDVLLDGIQFVVSAVQGPSDLFHSSVPNSPASSRINFNSKVSLFNASSTPPSDMGFLSVLIGFLKLDNPAAAFPESPRFILPTGAQSPSLGLKYKLTWSNQSLYTAVPVYDLTAYWNTPAVPDSLKHLGAPHYIITATISKPSADLSSSNSVTEVLCQGRTWNASWFIAGLPAAGTIFFSVSTVYPDYSAPENLSERVQIAWPSAH